MLFSRANSEINNTKIIIHMYDCRPRRTHVISLWIHSISSFYSYIAYVYIQHTCSLKIQIFRGSKPVYIHTRFRSYAKQTIAYTHTSQHQCIPYNVRLEFFFCEASKLNWEIKVSCQPVRTIFAEASVGVLEYYMWMALFDRVAYCFCYCW